MRPFSPRTALLAVVLVLSMPGVALAQPAARGPSVEVLGMVSELDDADDHGLALDAGARLALGRYFALGFDLGYGVMTGARDAQDRWWMIPTAAMVVPVDDLRFELGAGVGLGATSGYTNLDAFARGPFDPTWAFQLAPTIRLHASLSWHVSDGCFVFVRLDAASLMLEGNTIGYRAGNAMPTTADTFWMTSSLGVSFRP